MPADAPLLDADACWRAVASQDARFDGRFVVGVTSTGIYCRPSCPARTPAQERCTFHRSAAAAQVAGFRSCKRCRPDATPGSPEWQERADVAARAVRLVADGVVDRDGVAGLAARLGYSERQLHRVLLAELGAGALALARAQRAQAARTLLETTPLPVGEVAFAAGFGSVRQLNDTVRAVFAVTPTVLRAGARGRDTTAAGVLSLRLAFRPPLDWAGLVAFLAARAVSGVEEVDVAALLVRRSLSLPRGPGVVELSPGGPSYLTCRLHLTDLRDLSAAVARVRRLADLDADPVAVDAALASDPVLAPLVNAVPGRRVPGAVDGAELAARAVLGQQVSVAGARTLAGRLTGWLGVPLPHPVGAVTHLFPAPAALAALDPATLPMPRSRATALVGLAAALADGRVDLSAGAEPGRARADLLALPGIGPWTADYVAMRALRDPDVFLPTDLGVRRSLSALPGPADPSTWRPWRSYALMHLWAAPATAREAA